MDLFDYMRSTNMEKESPLAAKLILADKVSEKDTILIDVQNEELVASVK